LTTYRETLDIWALRLLDLITIVLLEIPELLMANYAIIKRFIMNYHKFFILDTSYLRIPIHIEYAKQSII